MKGAQRVHTLRKNSMINISSKHNLLNNPTIVYIKSLTQVYPGIPVKNNLISYNRMLKFIMYIYILIRTFGDKLSICLYMVLMESSVIRYM